MVAPTVTRVDCLCGGNFVVWQRATTGRPYRENGDNEFQFVDFLFERIFVYQIWLHSISKSSSHPVGVDCFCGGNFAVLCGRPKVAPTVGNGIMKFNSLIFCLRKYLFIKYGYTLPKNTPPNP